MEFVMGANRLLLLKGPELRSRIDVLLERVSADAGLRQVFLNDPAGVVNKFVFPDEPPVPSAEINRGNRLLYALLTNDRFMQWAREYEEQLRAEAIATVDSADPAAALEAYMVITNRGKIHRDLARAVAEFADTEMIAALTWKPTSQPGSVQMLPRPAVEIEVFIYAVAAVAVFIVAVAVIGLAPSGGEPLARADLQVVANELAASITHRAAEVRGSGVLTDFSQRDIGYTR